MPFVYWAKSCGTPQVEKGFAKQNKTNSTMMTIQNTLK
jgi:hypothetical protein